MTYHFVHEEVSNNEWRKAYIKTALNPVDIFTKAFPTGLDRKRKVRHILHDMNPHGDIGDNE